MCPDDDKVSANYPDECGRPGRLCFARKASWFTRDSQSVYVCQDDNKVSASTDKDGRPQKLCSAHAKQVGSHEVLNPCVMCPDDDKLDASFPDKDGRPHRLCAAHAKKVGSYKVQNPCVMCPDDDKTGAAFPDKDGRKNKLCSAHAVQVGTHVDTGHTGGSYKACRCLCLLEKALDIKIQHIHYILGGTHAGSEKRGLLPDHPKMRPDGFCPDPSGQSKGLVYQYHGNFWHGYPPDHPQHSTYLENDNSNKWGPDLYNATLAKDKLYVAAGYRVFVVWEHEFNECLRVRCPRSVTSVLREVTL